MRAALAATLASLLVAACQPAPQSDSAFDAKVRAYLMAHPKDLRAALQNMQTSEEAADDAQARAALPALRAALEHDPRDFAANPNGKVTVTEFYDYRCPHCINIAPQVVALVRSRPDVRFVFKEMPIFGSTSEHAARAALAAKAQGKDYVGLYQAMMSTKGLDDAAIDRIAAANGVDVAAMNAPATVARDRTQFDDIGKLATRLSIDGTPGFVVGDTIIKGEDYEGLAAAIAAAEKAKKA
ncbi:MAG TPA: thioredoxin domain-containing protein [Caulobacteraceae bacterium]|jgi:protein-disulfide isomerase|nr:thioredoxin domain-containing protein [Caulobacteraceae bacterium]